MKASTSPTRKRSRTLCMDVARSLTKAGADRFSKGGLNIAIQTLRNTLGYAELYDKLPGENV
jgi:hypothetical protein